MYIFHRFDFFLFGLCDKCVDRSAEKVCNLFDNVKVWDRFATLPFRHGFIRIIEFIRKFGLRHPQVFSKKNNVFRKIVFNIHNDYYNSIKKEKNQQKTVYFTSYSTAGRVDFKTLFS